MKNLILIICLLSTIACDFAGFVHEQVDDNCKEEPIHLNICVLGNSYSNDSFSYVPFILKEYGITCNIHIYYRGSGSLHDLHIQWNDAAEYGIADLDGKEHIRLHFSIDTRTQTKWSRESRLSANDILSLEKWDIVSLQQGGNRAKDKSSYYPYLSEVITKIDSVCNYDYNLAWFMAYNSARDNDDIKSIETQKFIIEATGFDMVFPVATAVFTAQQSPILSKLGESVYNNLYSADNIHLQEGLPCYLAALTIVQSIIDRYLPGESVIGDTIRPSQEWIQQINGITPDGESIGVSEDNCDLAQRIAILANMNKYLIINNYI